AVDGVVVDLASDGDLVLDLVELLLEVLEVLRRAQRRVSLCDGEEATERRGERVLGLGLLLDSLRVLRRRARCGYLLEDAALMARVSLDRLDQVRNQVVPALQLHIDLRPRVFRPVAEPDETVVEHDDDEPDQQDHRDGDDRPDHRARKARGRRWWCSKRIAAAEEHPARADALSSAAGRTRAPEHPFGAQLSDLM